MAEPIGNDATGYDVLTAAMKSLLNQFPGLYPDEVIKFEELGSEDGIAFSNDSGALVYTEKEDIIGRIYQECRYPCFVVYRSTTGARERQKITILEFLDTLGRWLCHEPSGIEGKEYEKAIYPDLTAGRRVERVTRGNAYGTQPQGMACRTGFYRLRFFIKMLSNPNFKKGIKR